MKKYTSFFRMRFIYGLQYRAAALAGCMTQFVWAMMEICMFRAFYEAGAENFPMDFSALVSYVWLQQAFLALFMMWFFEIDIFESIEKGTIAYELCRPLDLYNMWFARSMATRLSKAVLRAIPILLLASFLPEPFRLILPGDIAIWIEFIVTMTLGFLVVVAFGMLIYMASFFMISSAGIRMISVTLVEFFSGAVIPLPFLPDQLYRIVSFFPFASMQNVPLQIFGGNLSGVEALEMAGLQLFWLATLVGIGKWLAGIALKRVVVQGG